VSLHPEPTFLLTLLSCPEDTSAPFIVEDLFGRGPSARMQRLVADGAKKADGLAKQVSLLVGHRSAANAERFSAAREDLLRECRDRVVEQLSLKVLESDQLFAQLIEVELALILSDRDARPEDTKSALVAAQKALELLLAEWRMSYPVPTADRQSFRANREGWFEYVEGCASVIGAHIPLPDRLAGLRAEDIEKALGGKGVASLRILLVVCIVAAIAYGDHPLRAAVKDGPEVIKHIDDIATLRNKSAHGKLDAPTAAEARLAHTTVMALVRRALGLPFPQRVRS
jgi:hypothetical protein